MTKLDEPLYFGGMLMKRGSAQTWVIGEGHVESIEVARQKAMDELAEAEESLRNRQAELDEAAAELRTATLSRDRAYDARQKARKRVKSAQERIAYVCAVDTPPVDE